MELNSSLSPTSISPSFNSYSNTDLSYIAQRVIREFENEADEYKYGEDEEEEEFNFVSKVQDHYSTDKQQSDLHVVVDELQEQEFEFCFHVQTQNPLKPANEIFQNGLIRPVYSFQEPKVNTGRHKNNIRVSLRKLFMEERDQSQTTTSSTSDDDDGEEEEELVGVPPESYCVWRPGTANAAAAAGVCKKSWSTGSVSRKWKLMREILGHNRSRSDGGKGSLVFPSEGSGKTAAYGGGANRRATTVSYDLPYRQDLAGVLFGNNNANGLGKNLRH